MTTEQRINSSELWTDVCFVTGEFGIFISAAMVRLFKFRSPCTDLSERGCELQVFLGPC